MRVFRLYQFSDGLTNVITRGLTVEQAMSYAVKSPAFKRGSTIFPINFAQLMPKHYILQITAMVGFIVHRCGSESKSTNKQVKWVSRK